MQKTLSRIRAPKRAHSPASRVLMPILALLLGALLGAFAKWLDNLALDDAVAWHRLVGALDLGNVFSEFAIWLLLALALAAFSPSPGQAVLRVFLFFAGMCAAYHAWTVAFSGFDPAGYMRIWYAITLVSPLPALACWYAKGRTAPSVCLGALILAVMARCCFSVGWFYFGLNGTLNAVIFLAAVAVLYVGPVRTAVEVAAGIALAVLIGPYLPL